jgi:hypothetical protein
MFIILQVINVKTKIIKKRNHGIWFKYLEDEDVISKVDNTNVISTIFFYDYCTIEGQYIHV